MIAAFVALNVLAIRAMRRAGTTVRPDRGTDHLVVEGPFSLTRNPLYLAGTTLVLGIGLVSGIVWFLLLAVLAAFAVYPPVNRGLFSHVTPFVTPTAESGL
jgi:protein-S-isoprenylcysteine O-methyltransferase Ste14